TWHNRGSRALRSKHRAFGARKPNAKSKNYRARNAKKMRSNVPDSRAPRLYSAPHCRLSRQAVSFLDQTSPGAHGGESDVEAARGTAAVDERPGYSGAGTGCPGAVPDPVLFGTSADTVLFIDAVWWRSDAEGDRAYARGEGEHWEVHRHQR